MEPAFDHIDSRKIARLVSGQKDPHQILLEEIGPAFAEYRRKWDLARTFKLKLPFPLHVDYEFSFTCNLRCAMCVMSLPPERRRPWGDPTKSLNRRQVFDLIDHGAEHGQAAAGLNGICEPLLFPYVPEVIAHARKRGLLDVMFNTNGLLLDRELSKDLIEAGLTRIMFSLDAMTEETYRRIRRGGDFRKVLENVFEFMALRNERGSRLPLIRVSFCVTSLNEHELPDLIDFWKTKADFISIQQYSNTFNGSDAVQGDMLRPIKPIPIMMPETTSRFIFRL